MPSTHHKYGTLQCRKCGTAIKFLLPDKALLVPCTGCSLAYSVSLKDGKFQLKAVASEKPKTMPLSTALVPLFHPRTVPPQ
jgi:hypothetical protein